MIGYILLAVYLIGAYLHYDSMMGQVRGNTDYQDIPRIVAVVYGAVWPVAFLLKTFILVTMWIAAVWTLFKGFKRAS